MVEIRIVRSDEIEQVLEVDREAFADSPFGELTGLKGKSTEERKGWQSVENFQSYCVQYPDRVIVAVAEGRVVGFAALEYWPEKQMGKVKNSAVLAAYREQGIGIALIERLVEETKSLGARTIEVKTSHVPAACRMYEKAGFKLLKRDRKQTEDGRGYDDSSYELRFS